MLRLVRKKFRRAIFPSKDVLEVLRDLSWQRVLDVGAGTGFFLELLASRKKFETAYGVEVNPSYYRRISANAVIGKPGDISGGFDLIVFNDVLHHVAEKEEFLHRYINNYLRPNGYVLIKDMNPEKLICKYFNRFHDFVFSGESIEEIDQKELLSIVPNSLEVVRSGAKRIGPYDHYYLLFKKGV